LLPREDPHEALFDVYGEALSGLCAADNIPVTLRRFEKRLLAELGYAPLLDRDSASRPIDPERQYVYELERGPVAANGSQGGERSGLLRVSGRTLLDVAADDYGRSETRDEARALMRALITQRLQGRELHTRSVLKDLSEL